MPPANRSTPLAGVMIELYCLTARMRVSVPVNVAATSRGATYLQASIVTCVLLRLGPAQSSGL